MANRTNWKFGYKGKDLRDRTVAQQIYHEERVSFWKDEAEKAETRLKSEGVTLKDYQMSGGVRYEAHVDQSLGNRLEECRSKVLEHERKRDEYAMFARAFELNPDADLALDADDIRFFGL